MPEGFAGAMYRRRWAVVAAWTVLLVGVGVAAATWGGDRAVDGDPVQLVFHAPEGLAAAPTAAHVAAVERAMGDVADVREVRSLATSPDGTVLLAEVRLEGTAGRVPRSTVRTLMEIAEYGDTAHVTVDVGGPAVQAIERGRAGAVPVGILAAIAVAVIALGSVAAAGLVALVALCGVGVALGVVELLGRLIPVPDWAPQLVAMVGLGLGAAGALLVVARHREARRAGLDGEDAVVRALPTTGRAVVLAGGTAVVALLGVAATGLADGTAVVTIATVLVVVAATTTLLPAGIGLAGRRIDRLGLPLVPADRGELPRWPRWSGVVRRHPRLIGLGALAVLAALAVPLAGLRVGQPDAGTDPTTLTSRRAHDLVAGAFGPGANGPLVVAVDTDADVAGLASSMRATPGVASVLPLPTSRQLVHRLRHDVVPERVDVGGAAARSVDERELLGRWFPWLIGAVVGLSFVLLLALFRSVLAALGAVVAHVLAVAAACGVMALAAQGGWSGRLVGITAPTPIPAWVPLTVLALLSGWSLAAEVTRMVAAPAAAVVAVGASFLLADRVEIKVFALGLAVAVLLDATLVRMVLPRLDVEPREPPAAPAPPTAVADEDDDEWELVGV